MTKVELMTTTEQPQYFRDMEIRDLGIITKGAYLGEYVLRLRDSVVCLNDGGEWSSPDAIGCNIPVRILDKGEQIVLTQE